MAPAWPTVEGRHQSVPTIVQAVWGTARYFWHGGHNLVFHGCADAVRLARVVAAREQAVCTGNGRKAEFAHCSVGL